LADVKKQVDCFWSQEVDTSKDVEDWNVRPTNGILSPWFRLLSSSDGLVIENLAVRFMGEVQLAEARALRVPDRHGEHPLGDV
jgi:ribonucleoside-diphosphate reductase subunit M2